MDLKDFVIATISWARDETEEKLLRQALAQLALLKVPVYITDGGSSNEFLNFLRSFSHFEVMSASKKGLFAQVENSLSEARKDTRQFILYTEPDKLEFFKHGLPNMLAEIKPTEQTGIVLASRSNEGFSSFPASQVMTETTINSCCSEITKLHFDYSYGPFLLNKKLLQYIPPIENNIGWGWRPYIFCMAHRADYTINAVEGNYYCPTDQREDDNNERIYRMRQLRESIDGILLATKTEV